MKEIRYFDYNPGVIIFGTNAEAAISLLIPGANDIVKSIAVIDGVDVYGTCSDLQRLFRVFKFVVVGSPAELEDSLQEVQYLSTSINTLSTTLAEFLCVDVQCDFVVQLQPLVDDFSSHISLYSDQLTAISM